MQILIKPVISEKIMANLEQNKYIFEVHPKANKHQIASAIEEIYKVTVTAVNTIKVRRKDRIVRGRFKATTPEKKKAIVTLKKGDKIKGFEIKE